MSAADAVALFERDGSHLVPTPYARGPWRRDALHGAAVSALLASALETPGRTITRITFDLLKAAPFAPLTVEVGASEGGQRVARQTVSLKAGADVVAQAQCLAIRETELDLPESPSSLPSPFAGLVVPDLSSPRRSVSANIGWDSFDSMAVALSWLKPPACPPDMVCQYVNLLVPVVAGEPISAVARAAVAADFGSNHTYKQLPFDRWTFMNADLSLHLSRRPVGDWVAIAGTSITHRHGAGITLTTLVDEQGVLGQSSQSLLVEARA